MLRTILQYLSELLSIVSTETLTPDIIKSTLLYFTITLGFSIVATYIFKSIALMLFIKKQGGKHAWLAFIPFASFYFFGKHVIDVNLFSLKIKNAGLWVSILYFVSFSVATILDFYLYFGTFKEVLLSGNIVSEILIPNPILYSTLNVVSIILNFATWFFLAVLMLGFYGKYEQRHYFLFMLLTVLPFSSTTSSVLFNIIFGVFLLILRNRKVITIEEILKQQIRMQQMQQNGAQVYNTSKPKVDEPFSEFDNSKNESSTINQDVFSDFSPNNDYSSAKNSNSTNSSSASFKPRDLNNPNSKSNEQNNSNDNTKDEDDLF